MKAFLQRDTDAVHLVGNRLERYIDNPPTMTAFLHDPPSSGRLIQCIQFGLDTVQAELQSYTRMDHVPLQMPNQDYDGKGLVLSWWARYDAMVDVLEKAVVIYGAWRHDINDWIRYTEALGINTYSLSLALHVDPGAQSIYADDLLQMAPLTLLTSTFLTQIANNRFFFSHPNNPLMPYASQIPVLLETASATKMAQMYCSDFDCTEGMRDIIYMVDYGSHPEVLHELTHFLTEQRRWMDKDDLSVAQQNSRLAADKYRYTISLPSECRKTKHTRLLCDMCSYYMTPIQFYLSQVDILDAYRHDLPYLLDLMPISNRRVIPLDFDRFNDQLSRTYRDVATFFGINDALLSYWLMKDWKTDINDLYVLFREDPELLRTTPPTSLMTAQDLATHTVDLNTWSLQSFWRRFFSIVKTHRTSWWERLLKIAVAYDMYAQKAPLSQINHNPLSLTMQCRNTKSIFDCISLLYSMFSKPDLASLFTAQQRRNMLVRTQLLYGRLEVYEDMAEKLREMTPSSLRSKIKRLFTSSSPVSPTNHSSASLQVPPLPTLVSDNEMLQGDDGRYQYEQSPIPIVNTRVFTVDDDGFIMDPIAPFPSTSPPPPPPPQQSTRPRPRLQQQKSFWRQFNKE